MPQQLADEHRAKLDAIVQRMEAAGEPEDAIRFVVSDFKSKYAPQAPDVRQRPLLMGHSDAGAAKQFSDPSAMADLNAAKDTGANVGIATGAMALGGALAPASVTNTATALAKSAGQVGLYGGAYKGLTAMGIPPEYAGAILAVTGVKGALKGRTMAPQAEPAPKPSSNIGGRLVTAKGPGIEQEMANALAELRQPSSPKSVELAPQPQLPPGYTPRTSAPAVRMVGAKMAVASPSRVAAIEAAAPKPAPQAGPSEVQRNLSVIREPGDMPKSWHAFLNPEAREQAPAESRQNIGALHRELNDMDASYRAATAGERASLQAIPQSFKDELVRALMGRR